MESNTRAAFDRLAASTGVRPRIMAVVDDMAILRLLAREGMCHRGFLLLVQFDFFDADYDNRGLADDQDVTKLLARFSSGIGVAPER